ncbi:MAG: HPr family phosphocarrier protein [Eubacterium sp.]|jgi:phosphocarrier protein HPr|nr:HPr family phosphocarrier protein [Eubacterium sp.]
MTERKVRFKDSEEVENFVNAAGQCDFEIDILSDHIYIDAKSLLGVLGLGFKRELTVKYFGENAKFETLLENYAVA